MNTENNTFSASVIVPSYNEEEAIGEQIKKIRNVLSKDCIDHEIIVVDDGSRDRTGAIASTAGARVLRHTQNRGYGAAIKTAIRAAQYERIVIIDADGTYPVDQIPVLISMLSTADMVVGARTGKHVQIPWARRPAKWFLRKLATRIAGEPIADLNSGLRAFWGDCVKQYFSILPDRFSFTTTITLALLADSYTVLYHPINYYKRIGKSKILPWHFMDFVALVLRTTVIFQPLRIFVPLSLVFGVSGLIKFVFDVVALFQRATVFDSSLLYQPVLSTSAILLLLVGLQLLLIGMVADGVLRRIIQHSKQPLVSTRAVIASETNSQERSNTIG